MTTPSYTETLRKNPVYQSILNYLSIYLNSTRRRLVDVAEFEKEASRFLGLLPDQVTGALNWLSGTNIIYWEYTFKTL